MLRAVLDLEQMRRMETAHAAAFVELDAIGPFLVCLACEVIPIGALATTPYDHAVSVALHPLIARGMELNARSLA